MSRQRNVSFCQADLRRARTAHDCVSRGDVRHAGFEQTGARAVVKDDGVQNKQPRGVYEMEAYLKIYMIAEHHRQQRLREAEQHRLAQVSRGRTKEALAALSALLSALLVTSGIR